MRLSSEPVNSWESPSRFGRAGKAYRRFLRRALQPYDIRRQEIDRAVASAFREVDARLRDADTGVSQDVAMPPVWADDHRPPRPPLAPIHDLAGGQPMLDDTMIESAIANLASFGAQHGQLLSLGPEGIRERMLADGMAIPAPDDRQGYSTGDHLAYWLSGLADSLLLERLAAGRGRPLKSGCRVLDIGCASGRVLRHLHSSALGLELFGVDIGLVHVEWARQHLPPAITVAQATVLPTLPFEDASIDVIYGLSLFTHVADFEEALLLEVQRVMRPQGFALFTIHSERLWEELCQDPDFWMRRVAVDIRHRAEPMWTEPIADSFFAGSMPAGRLVLRNVSAHGLHHTNVIHAEAWIRDRWGRLFEIERVEPSIHGSHQDGVVLSRPAR